MVDVGHGNGAVVIYTRDLLSGTEIEVSPRGEDTRRTHTEVLRRKTQSGYVHAAVFGSLAQGNYRIWHESLVAPVEVTVMDGQVTELDWR